MTNGSSASYSFGLNNQLTGQVTGKVFADLNRNGVLDGSEAGLPNVWVGVSNNGGVNVAGYAYTDASGSYSVTVPINDPPHTTPYAAYFTPPAGYFPTLGLSIGSLWVQHGAT